MFRSLLVAVSSLLLFSIAHAKDLCIQLDTGPIPGSHVVLKKVSLGRGAVAPAQGYLAQWSADLQAHYNFSPIDGQSIVGSKGLVIGLSWHEVATRPDSINVLNDNVAVNIGCVPGTDGKFGPLDACTAFVADTPTNAHIIDCKAVPPIP